MPETSPDIFIEETAHATSPKTLFEETAQETSLNTFIEESSGHLDFEAEVSIITTVSASS